MDMAKTKDTDGFNFDCQSPLFIRLSRMLIRAQSGMLKAGGLHLVNAKLTQMGTTLRAQQLALTLLIYGAAISLFDRPVSGSAVPIWVQPFPDPDFASAVQDLIPTRTY